MAFLSRKPTSRQQSVPARRRQPNSGEVRTPRTESTEDPSAFRRNRTLTGSPSSHVRGAVEHAGQMKSGRVQAHELSVRRRRLGGLFALATGVSLVLLIVVLNFTATVAVDTPGVTRAVNSTRYSESINDYLAYRPIERIRLFTDNKQLTAHVAHEHPEVSSVAVNGGAGFAVSVFEVQLRKPLAAWTINDRRYYVDAKGVSFELNQYESPEISVVDDSGVPVAAGVSIASNRFLSYVGRTIALFQAQGVEVSKVVIPFNTTRQIEVVLKGRDYPVRLSIDRQVGVQVEDAVRAVRYVDATQKTPQYIDVRVSGKAFYQE